VNVNGISVQKVVAKKCSWLNENSWKALHHCFGKFDKQNGWHALNNTIKLFRKVAKGTARYLRYEYNEKLDRYISQFIAELEDRTKRA
jgi:hypothetical protein